MNLKDCLKIEEEKKTVVTNEKTYLVVPLSEISLGNHAADLERLVHDFIIEYHYDGVSPSSEPDFSLCSCIRYYHPFIDRFKVKVITPYFEADIQETHTLRVEYVKELREFSVRS